MLPPLHPSRKQEGSGWESVGGRAPAEQQAMWVLVLARPLGRPAGRGIAPLLPLVSSSADEAVGLPQPFPSWALWKQSHFLNT